ncbi:hypothetical protein L2Y96_18060 [Luteibacter aegosomaticola]|uniref:hypothetical protein n=1 Tax=Luteibacter aegosomaticola TaxID=2911538 RepID=UPI001FF9B468|nr:hypothetical protein [Luteibacter aegosomaticola]UPG89284.1 hypothetical protein L2Y96_18060 [Luteibacter aegosomaticola]
MNKIYAYAIGGLLAVIAVGCEWWYVDSLQTDLADARRDLSTVQGNTDRCALALTQANDATAAAEAKWKLMQGQAQALIDDSAGQKAKNNTVGTAFAAKVTESAKAPDCHAVLEAQLCPALSGY